SSRHQMGVRLKAEPGANARWEAPRERKSARRFVLHVALRFLPDLSHRQSQAALDPDRLMRFIWHGVRALDPAGEPDRAQQPKVLLARPADLDHHAAIMTLRPPNPIIVVATDCRRQPKPPSIDVDGGRLAVIAARKYRPGAILRRQRPIDIG